MEEMGFSSTAELLQRVEGVEMKRPPSAKAVVVFKTASFLEEKKKEKEKLVRTWLWPPSPPELLLSLPPEPALPFQEGFVGPSTIGVQAG